MIRFSILLFFLSFTAFAQEQKIAEGVILYRDLFNTSMKNGVACYRIPSLVTAANGDIIAAIDERIGSCSDLRGNRDINIVIRRSKDGGETWLEIETIVDYPAGRSASDPSMIVDDITGEIIMFYNYMDLDKAKDVYHLHCLKSKDNGNSWSRSEDITSQITKKQWNNDFKFITSGRGSQTRSGTLLHSIVNLERGLHLFESNDHGSSWHLIDTPIHPGDESKFIELTDGTWMINSRVNKEGLRFVHLSENSGLSWKSLADSSLIDPGCNASIIRYTADFKGNTINRMLFSNAKNGKSRENLSVRISYDEGQSWSDGKTIYAGQSAYSSLTILKNGDIGLLFEKDDYKENVFVKFSLDWLTDGSDSLN